jgi:hypothetical protein
MEEGDLAVHGHEVYPSDVPSLGFPGGIPGWIPAPSTTPTGGGAVSFGHEVPPPEPTT